MDTLLSIECIDCLPFVKSNEFWSNRFVHLKCFFSFHWLSTHTHISHLNESHSLKFNRKFSFVTCTKIKCVLSKHSLTTAQWLYKGRNFVEIYYLKILFALVWTNTSTCMRKFVPFVLIKTHEICSKHSDFLWNLLPTLNSTYFFPPTRKLSRQKRKYTKKVLVFFCGKW